MSEPQSHASEADRENVIQAFKDRRAKEPSKQVAFRISHTRPSLIRRVFRTVAFGFIAACIALGVVVWQSGSSEEMGKDISAFQAWLTQSLPVAHSSSATPIVGSTKAPTENTAVSRGTGLSATSRPTEDDLNTIKRQIEAVTNQLTEVRRIAEQLATNQEKMGQDIAVLKADQESINKRLLAVSAHSPNASAAPKKKPQEPARLGLTGRSSSEHSSVGAPLPLR